MANIKIRKASLDDLQGIYNLLNDCYNEFHYEYAPGEPLAVMTWAHRVISEGHTFVAMSEDRVVGSVGLHATTFPWNNSFWYLIDEWIFIDPEFRRGGTASGLIKCVMEYAETVNPDAVTPVQIAITFGDKPEAKDRFFKMKGLKYIGGIFMNGFEERSKDGQEEQFASSND
jgi:GNAT superfamily N-acetyltransferase